MLEFAGPGDAIPGKTWSIRALLQKMKSSTCNTQPSQVHREV